MPDRDLIETLNEFNRNMNKNTEKVIVLTTEVSLSRAVEEKNLKFMQDVCMKLIENDIAQDSKRDKNITKMLDWLFKAMILLLLTVLGLKAFVPGFMT